MEFRLCTIDKDYIDYLRSDSKLSNVFDNKDDSDFVRKYLGVVFRVGNYYYYAPLSSPKETDYKIVDGCRVIRNDIIPIIRIAFEEDGCLRLKGTLKLSNMIPVPADKISYYDIEAEDDEYYKALVTKEYIILKQKKEKILKNAKRLYRQKTCEHEIYTGDVHKPGYLSATVDFKYAEQMHDKYIQEHSAS